MVFQYYICNYESWFLLWLLGVSEAVKWHHTLGKRVVAKPPINSSPVYGEGAETKTEPVSKT